jgi:hypothetical protein
MEGLRSMRPLLLVACAALCLASGCSSHPSITLPPQVAGQLPADYRMGHGRGLILARFTVSTQGQPGFGAISNPLLVELREAGMTPADENPQGLALPHANAYVWGSERDVPTVWQYQPPGLMAASFKPATYDGLLIAYPDTSESSMEPDSIPAPSRGMRFEPIALAPDSIVYIGNITVEQHYSFWDHALDRVHVDYTVSDDYERSLADFRARYPQFAETPVEKRLAKVVTD